MDCPKIPFIPDTPNDDLVLLHQFSVSETYAMHTHDYYEVFYVIRGQAMHQINGSSQVVSEGSLVFIRPEDTHYYNFINVYDFEFVNINIARTLTKEAFQWMQVPMEYFDDPALPPTIKLTGTLHVEMRRKFLELSQMPSGLSRRRSFCALFPEIILLLYAQENAESSAVVPEWLSELIKKLDDPACFTLGLPVLLKMTPYTQEHLTRSFRKYINISPTAYINQKRLSYAAELVLSEEALTPPEIAKRVGFNNISHFYHLFKNQYGCTPLQFASQYRATQMGQMKYLLDIHRDAVQRCLTHNASRVPLEDGIFAYYMDKGSAHIFISFQEDATDENLATLEANWDARINTGAYVYINRENQRLVNYIQDRFNRSPILQVRQLMLTQERFVRHWDKWEDARIDIRGYEPEKQEDYLALLEDTVSTFSVGSSRSYAERSDELRAKWTVCQEKGRFLALYVEGKLAGFTCLGDDVFEILALAPGYCDQDCCYCLLYEGVRHIFETGKAQCLLDVDDRSPEALNFYRGLSFIQVAHEAIFSL